MKINTIISLVSATAVLIIALAAFLLSFNAIRSLAIVNGYPPALAWLVPGIVDAAMIAFSLHVLQATIYGRKAVYGWCLVLAFTAVSVYFNVSHSNMTVQGIAIAALAPLALLASFEVLMKQVGTAVQDKLDTVASHWQSRAKRLLCLAKEWKAKATALQLANDGLQSDVTALQSRLANLQEQVNGLPALKRQLRTVQDELDTMKAQPIIPQAVGAYGRDLLQVVAGLQTAAQMAERYNVSESTISREKARMNGGVAP